MYECVYFENCILLRRLLHICFIAVLLFAIKVQTLHTIS